MLPDSLCSAATEPQVLVSSIPTKSPGLWFWDNGASVSCVKHKSFLVDVPPCTPFSIGGVVGTAIATHVGYLPFLPRKYGKALSRPIVVLTL